MPKERLGKPTLSFESEHLSVENPEDRESFEGQRVLVIGGSDAHGISVAVTSAQYLEERGAEAEIRVGSPVIREGVGATHSAAFYSKTLPDLDVSGYDRVVIADIPQNIRNISDSEASVLGLVARLDRDREERGLAKIAKPVFILDHQSTASFQASWPAEEGGPRPPANVESHGVVNRFVAKAELCRLGHESSRIARIGAICDRDPAVLPVSDEEMRLARGLDAAVRPDPDYPRPTPSKDSTPEQKEAYRSALKAWEDATQDRLEEAVRRLKAEDWAYFQAEAERASHVEIPTSGGFGQVAIVDTQGLAAGSGVLKLMEMAIEKSGIDKTPYAIGVLRQLQDDKMGREPADVVTIIRHWTREDLPSVNSVIAERLGTSFEKRSNMYGALNAKSIRLPVNDRETARVVADLVEAFGGREIPDFQGVKSVIMCGDPNSGKSVYSAIFREALGTLGVSVAHLDLDKAAPTPQWYLDAEINYKKAELLFARGEIKAPDLESARLILDQAAERRRAMKRPWSLDLAEEAKQELQSAAASGDHEFVIGDIGGGRITKDPEGKIVRIQRLTAENARILEGTDAVIIVSSNPEGAAEWRRLIEEGVDPETGVAIKREKPIRIIGIYHSVLEGNVQSIADQQGVSGVVSNLDRSKAEKKYNPAIFATATFVARAIEARRAHEAADRE